MYLKRFAPRLCIVLCILISCCCSFYLMIISGHRNPKYIEKPLKGHQSTRKIVHISNDSITEYLQKLKEHQPTKIVANGNNSKAEYLQFPEYDVTFGDMSCNTVKNCALKIPHSPEEAKKLCNNEPDCKGFAFRVSTRSVYFKRDMSGKIIEKPDITLYIKKKYTQGLELPRIIQRECAVPVDGEIRSNFSGGCNLAEFDPFDPSMMKHISKPDRPLACPGRKLTRYKNGVLQFLEKDPDVLQAEYFPIVRIPHNDFNFTEGKSKPVNLNKENQVNDEFIRVKTKTKDGKTVHEFHASVVPKLQKVTRSKNSKGIPLNVMIIGIDSVSNAQFQRALAETYQYMTNELNSIVMKGYTIVGDGTTPALTAFLTGYFEKELPEARRGFAGSQTVDNWPWIFKEFKDSGYITMFSEDSPNIASFNYRLHGFNNPPTDHFSRYFWLAAAPNIRLCVGGKPQHSIHLDYIDSFFEAYPKTPKFGFAYFTSISHNQLSSLYYFADDFSKFIKNFKQKMNDTILIVLGDHGFRYGKARSTLQGHLEERLPFLSFTFPSWFEAKYTTMVKNLRHNAKSVTSPFDLHLTLRHIMSFPDVPKPAEGSRGSSLFEKIPRSRDCELAGVAEHYCPCLNLKTADKTHEHIQLAANAVADHINKKLSTDKYANQLCQQLEVQQILSSHQQMPNTKFDQFLGPEDIHGRIPQFSETHHSIQECNYHIQIRTSPGGGLFEAPVRFKDDEFVVTGDISRINKYGDQPRCILDKNRELRKYCLCKNYVQNTNVL